MANYAGPILGVVGAGVGAMVGGPAGAKWGWMIGSTVGGMIASSMQVIPGPKIGDVSQQTSQEGGFRPIVYGISIPLMGNVLADGGPIIVRKRQRQGKGGPKVETEAAYRTYAVGFCEGESELISAWRNGILVYDNGNSKMAAANAKFLEYARWHTGSFEQMPDPSLEGIYGVGNTPAFRGTSYLVLTREDVTDQRGAWSQWQVKVNASKPDAYVTSRPYAKIYYDSMLTSGLPLGGKLETLLEYGEAQAEKIVTEAAPVSGRLFIDLPPSLQPEAIVTSGVPASGRLKEPPSGRAVEFIVTSGKLETSSLHSAPLATVQELIATSAKPISGKLYA